MEIDLLPCNYVRVFFVSVSSLVNLYDICPLSPNVAIERIVRTVFGPRLRISPPAETQISPACQPYMAEAATNTRHTYYIK